MAASEKAKKPYKKVQAYFKSDEFERLATVAEMEKLPLTRLVRRVLDDYCKGVIAKGKPNDG